MPSSQTYLFTSKENLAKTSNMKDIAKGKIWQVSIDQETSGTGRSYEPSMMVKIGFELINLNTVSTEASLIHKYVKSNIVYTKLSVSTEWLSPSRWATYVEYFVVHSFMQWKSLIPTTTHSTIRGDTCGCQYAILFVSNLCVELMDYILLTIKCLS